MRNALTSFFVVLWGSFSGAVGALIVVEGRSAFGEPFDVWLILFGAVLVLIVLTGWALLSVLSERHQ